MDIKEPQNALQLPPGFRFHPSDEELIVHYLRKKVVSSPLPASVITEIDLYMYNPWELPGKALFGNEEWFFFTPRDRKYPNGSRPNRAAGSGYWKATGTDKHILTSCGTTSIGVKKALVFYQGRPPKGAKTDWIMNEYRLLETMICSTTTTSKRKGYSMRLDDWVLCRVRKKSNINNLRNTWELDNRSYDIQPHQAGCFRRVLDDDDGQPCPKSTKTTNNTTTPQNLEMIIEYLYKDFPMLPYIFSTSPVLQVPSSVGAGSSTLSFQSSEDGSKKISSVINGQLISPLSASNHHDNYDDQRPQSTKTMLINMDHEDHHDQRSEERSNIKSDHDHHHNDPEACTLMKYDWGLDHHQSKGDHHDDQVNFNANNHDWTSSNLQLYQDDHTVAEITGTAYDL